MKSIFFTSFLKGVPLGDDLSDFISQELLNSEKRKGFDKILS